MSDFQSELDPVEELAESFLTRYRRGERPAVTEYTQKYPELADKIRDLFPALVMMEELGSVAGHPETPSDSPTAEDRQMPRQLGEYRILREVGRGGMGVVYEAVQESLGRHVALKVLAFHGLVKPTYLERFGREARAAARLHHTNIVPVFGIGEHQGIHYYAMQFIQGQGLDAVLKEVRRLRNIRDESADRKAELRGELTVSIAHSLLTGQYEAPPENSGTRTPEWETSPGSRSGVSSAAVGITSSTSSRDSGLASQPEAQYFRSVARLAVQVAEALDYAHKQGILHRDIKPSNLLLDTRGTVWITDFGLVKAEDSDELTSPGDIVGTVRYMAPERFEGRSDPRSDLYSLGMTLYELLSLRPAFEDSNRARLIQRIAGEQPARPRKLDPHIPRDLETVVSKAIAKDPADRYQTAAELAEDLERFLADRPIKARRSSLLEQTIRWCRRNRQVAALVASVAFLLVTIAVVSSLYAFWLNKERNATQDQLELKEKAEAKATLRLFNSLVNQARASRLTGRVGQRFESLKALTEAAELLPSLHLEPKAILELRNDAIAGMVLPDLRLVRSWDGNLQGNSGITFDADLERYARTDNRGSISIRRVADDQEIMNLRGPGEPAWIVRFSPNGRYLAAKYHHGNTPYANQCWLWELERQEKVLRAPAPITGMDFSPDSRWLAIGFLRGELKVYDLTSEKKDFIGLPPGPTPEFFAFHPDGQKLAIARSQSVLLWDLKTGKADRVFTLPGNVRGIAWHPEGKLLAAAGDKGYAIHVWNAITGQPQAELKGHQAEVFGLVFNHAGDVLLSYGHDGTIRLWDPWTGHQLLSNSQGQTQFSRNGLLLAGRLGGSTVGLWEVALGRECRKLSTSSLEGTGPWSVDFNYGGRLLASAHDDGVRLWDLATWTEAAWLNTGASQSAIFDGKGKRLITAGVKGAQLWHLVDNRQDPDDILELGPPALLAETARSGASWSKDARILALADGSHSKAIVLDLETNPKHVWFHYGHPLISNAAVSPDGRWVASASWRDSAGTVRVFDLHNQKHVRDFLHPNVSASITFTPDSKWLVIGAEKTYRFWEVGCWKAGLVVERTQAAGLPLPLAFSPDGQILAIVTDSLSAEPVRLLDSSTGQEFATVALPYPERVRWLCFSPDGSQLAACCSGHGIRVWDLRLIRQQLADIGLDWDLPPYPPAEPLAAMNPLKVKVLAGN